MSIHDTYRGSGLHRQQISSGRNNKQVQRQVQRRMHMFHGSKANWSIGGKLCRVSVIVSPAI